MPVERPQVEADDLSAKAGLVVVGLFRRGRRRRTAGVSEPPEGAASPAECIGAVKHRVEGNPDPKHVSTSFAERQISHRE